MLADPALNGREFRVATKLIHRHSAAAPGARR
jgi:hypothetical protein